MLFLLGGNAKSTSVRLICSINIFFALLCKARYKKARMEEELLQGPLLKTSHKNCTQCSI